MGNFLTFADEAVFAIFGVGVMGQHLAQQVLSSLPVKKLILVDAAPEINVQGSKMALATFASQLENPRNAEIVTVVGNITDEEAMSAVFKAHKGIHYLALTSGISPKPLTEPEALDMPFAMGVIEVNTWGPVNIVNCAIREKALAPRSKCAVLLSTAAVVGAQGRATVWYEISKWGLRGWMECQAGYYLTNHGLVINGLSPNPLQGPMAASNPASVRRVAAVVAESPMGLSTPENTTAQILFYLSNQCNSVGQNVVICGGYTMKRVHYGDLPVDASK